MKTSSNEDSIVLDCFCGNETTLKSAQINGRQWIGIDQSDEAIKATTEKLNDIKGDLFVSQTDFQLWTEKKHSPSTLVLRGQYRKFGVRLS
ncbi:MAG: hypothetical protein EPN85_09320 [Bacteroidetes bacterium]|nr:MAG: hypothetical protein EPN85_09320 [Bacteroidota bacterium]